MALSTYVIGAFYGSDGCGTNSGAGFYVRILAVEPTSAIWTTMTAFLDG